MFVAFLLGTIATYAEPAISTLTVLGSSIKYEKAPLLYDFLNNRTTMVLTLAAIGVGLGAINGIFRFLRNMSLKITILPGLAICVILTVIAAFDPARAISSASPGTRAASPPAPSPRRWCWRSASAWPACSARATAA
jgi:hypothetical protein